MLSFLFVCFISTKEQNFLLYFKAFPEHKWDCWENFLRDYKDLRKISVCSRKKSCVYQSPALLWLGVGQINIYLVLWTQILIPFSRSFTSLCHLHCSSITLAQERIKQTPSWIKSKMKKSVPDEVNGKIPATFQWQPRFHWQSFFKLSPSCQVQLICLDLV